MTELDECFKSGQLKRTAANAEKAVSSLRIAEENLNDARTHYDNGLSRWAFIASYTCMFHCARAILFNDGVKERSHFCLCQYVKEKYRGAIEEKYLNEFDILREQRHMIIYGDENLNTRKVQETEADSAIKLAAGFLEAVKKLIRKG